MRQLSSLSVFLRRLFLRRLCLRRLFLRRLCLRRLCLRRLFLRRLFLAEFISDTDRDILDTLVEHRVATTAQLSVLLEIPERTVRYRLAQLKTNGYTRAIRPSADRGSAPDHWCPTRRADSWAKGERAPHGGDHRAPSTTFVEHSAAITALYVALKVTVGRELELVEWFRETAAAEEFEWRSRRRKIVPDAFVLIIEEARDYRAFVEIDLGSMSMTRLSQKLSGYAVYYAAQAWMLTHPFPPVLLVLTTSESRADAIIRRFEQRWSQAEHHLSSPGLLVPRVPVPMIGACAAARSAEEAVTEPVWLSMDGSDGFHLTDLLRPAWERWLEQQQKLQEQERERDEWRANLAADPERCREKIRHSGFSRAFSALCEAFEGNNRIALELLLQRRHPMDVTEKVTFGFFSRRLAWTDQGAITPSNRSPSPRDEERRLAENLATTYLERQKRYVSRLFTQGPDSSAVWDAIEHLDHGGLLRLDEIDRLPGCIASDRNSLADQLERRRGYVAWREYEVEKERDSRGSVSRLMFDRGRAAYQLDLKHLAFCKSCRQVAIPNKHELANRISSSCSFCSLGAQTDLVEALRQGLVSSNEDGSWSVCHPPVPAWVTEEAARPLARTAGVDEEWQR
jgi:DNA-binding Lrp family transcriptional regulator